jgi:hypothetical protein
LLSGDVKRRNRGALARLHEDAGSAETVADLAEEGQLFFVRTALAQQGSHDFRVRRRFLQCGQGIEPWHLIEELLRGV